MKVRLPNLLRLVISILGCQLVGLAGTPFTVPATANWYAQLNKPCFTPPNWVFGPVWTSLYFLMGVVWYWLWRQGWQKKRVRTAGRFFLAQLGLNLIWSPVFFGLRAPLLGLVVIVPLWILIALTISKLYPLSKWVAGLLVPYWLWVSLATILNAAIVILN
jgi:benzodiazapine receptor